MATRDEARWVHSEVQPLPAWVWVVVLVTVLPGAGVAAGMVFGAISADPVATWVVIGCTLLVVALLAVFMGGVRIRVGDERLTARLGRWPFPLDVPLEDIEWCRATKYNPLRDFGGWGLRIGWRHSRVSAINGRGDEGVLLALSNGKRVLLGSDDPGQLTDALGSLGVEVKPRTESLDEALAAT